MYLLACLFIYLFFTDHLQFPLPLLLPTSSLQPPSVPRHQSTPVPSPQSTPLFLFRKGQISHEHQQNMEYQVAGRLSTLSKMAQYEE